MDTPQFGCHVRPTDHARAEQSGHLTQTGIYFRRAECAQFVLSEPSRCCSSALHSNGRKHPSARSHRRRVRGVQTPNSECPHPLLVRFVGLRASSPAHSSLFALFGWRRRAHSSPFACSVPIPPHCIHVDTGCVHARSLARWCCLGGCYGCVAVMCALLQYAEPCCSC